MDTNLELNEFLSQKKIAGKKELIQTMRFLSQEHLTEFSEEKIASWPDEIFLEPRLFSLLMQENNHHSPTQLLLDRFPELRSNNQQIVLSSRTEIDIVKFPDQIVSDFLKEQIGNSGIITYPKSQPYLNNLSTALKIIHDCNIKFYTQLIDCVKSVVLFEHPHANSLAALGLHGMIFLNVRWPTSILFFIDAFAHQGGHVILNEATLNREDFFIIDPDTLLGTVVNQQNDRRSVYEALHGLYTEYQVIENLLLAEEKSLLPENERAELIGRLAYINKRFQKDILKIDSEKNNIFSEEGLTLFNIFKKLCDQLINQKPELAKVDLSGQLNEFDVTEFMKKNTF